MRKIAGIFCLVFLSFLSSIGWAQDRPNILFAFADDWGRHASALVATDGPGTENDVVQTPNFDALAASGVLFKNAFVNAPSCTPCRSSILSGMYFWQTKTASILQGAVWDDSLPAWPLMLQKNGYHIGFTWKVWSPGRPQNAPYGRQANAFATAGSSFNGFSQTVTKQHSKGKSIDEAKQFLMQQVRGNFVEMLANRNDKPFAYWFGPTNVHRQWVKGSGKKLWGIDPDALQGKLPPFLPDVPAVREDFSDYLGEVQAFDMALGVLVEELKKAGEFENTIIVVSGDHGPAGFPHGKCNLYDFGTRVALSVSGPGINGNRVVDDFVSLPDLAPTFLAAGKVKVPNEMTAKSLWPTLSSNEQGLVDKSRSQVYIGRERHVESARAGFLPYPQRAIRTKDFLFVVNFKPDRFPLGDHYRLDSDNEPTMEDLLFKTRSTIPDEDAGPTKAWLVSNRSDPTIKPFFDHAYGLRPREELFDLNQDPHQMKNVALEPAYESVATRMRNQLMAELERTHDPRLIDDGKFFETPPMAGPLK